MDDGLANRIKAENIRVHREEASDYDFLHTEITNWYARRATSADIDTALRNLSAKTPVVLDVGCGTGGLSLKFLNESCRVTALDSSEEMLKVLEKKIDKSEATLVLEDADAYIERTDENFDVIAFSSVLHHLPDYIGTLKSALRLLRDGGVVFIMHEPLPITKVRLGPRKGIWRCMYKFDDVLFDKKCKRAGVKLGEIDYAYSDYHCTNGIDIDGVMVLLKEHNMEILKYVEYSPRKSALIQLLDNAVRHSKSHFRVIARNVG